MGDDLTLLLSEQSVSGWNSVRVTRGIERCPSDFDIEMTERYPGELSSLMVKPGDTCQVKLGNDVVITGYVDKVTPSISANQHTIRVAGRGKCQDLVECSAEWDGGQISSQTVLATAIALAAPYLITVNASCDVGAVIAQTNIQFGESPYEIIERLCRWRALLVYDQPDGSLLLSDVGTTMAASGFQEGINIEKASLEYSIDGRFSEYWTSSQSADVFGDIGDAGYLHAVSTDPLVLRHRRHFFHCEASASGLNLLQKRADWEAKRRLGRSAKLSITTDSWRDSAGVLYTPNTLVPLNIPSLRKVNVSWLITEVSYKRNQNGTTCDLVIMPEQAFSIGPMTEAQAIGGSLAAEFLTH